MNKQFQIKAAERNVALLGKLPFKDPLKEIYLLKFIYINKNLTSHNKPQKRYSEIIVHIITIKMFDIIV